MKYDSILEFLKENVWYNVRYALPRVFEEMLYSVKYAYQRVMRGYDDRALWSYYEYNSNLTLKILKHYRANKVGAPYADDPDGVLTTPDTQSTENGPHDSWFKRWDEALDIMIEGFEAFIKMNELCSLDFPSYDDYKKELDRLDVIWNKGAKLYIANYRGLWD